MVSLLSLISKNDRALYFKSELFSLFVCFSLIVGAHASDAHGEHGTSVARFGQLLESARRPRGQPDDAPLAPQHRTPPPRRSPPQRPRCSPDLVSALASLRSSVPASALPSAPSSAFGIGSARTLSGFYRVLPGFTGFSRRQYLRAPSKPLETIEP